MTDRRRINLKIKSTIYLWSMMIGCMLLLAKAFGAMTWLPWWIAVLLATLPFTVLIAIFFIVIIAAMALAAISVFMIFAGIVSDDWAKARRRAKSK